ncbi:hypothetical protein FrCorBMG51_11465 [Protofrankia coriariae]|uniref:Secreted protein n=1 Tax=Protofrankia coriariae TaxID=1562887 RepID=A0ABR5F3S5_9ACTN|nr:hypothetical protein FrCorBMG51_11465 [Protofrankia coriariae]
MVASVVAAALVTAVTAEAARASGTAVWLRSVTKLPGRFVPRSPSRGRPGGVAGACAGVGSRRCPPVAS